MTGTTEALGGSAAVDDAARSVTRPFSVYAVLANTLFQRCVFVLFLYQRGFSVGQVALLQTLLYLVSGLAELPTGVIADRIGRRASIVIGQMLIAGCLLGQVAFSNYWVFLALFIAQGLGMACVSGSDTALLSDQLVLRGATASYVKIKSRFTMLGTVASGAAIVLGGQLQNAFVKVRCRTLGCCLNEVAAGTVPGWQSNTRPWWHHMAQVAETVQRRPVNPGQARSAGQGLAVRRSPGSLGLTSLSWPSSIRPGKPSLASPPPHIVARRWLTVTKW
ncbi:hypothetical protein GCM10010304_06700 [Streptomyces roseoviolaceus]